MEANDFGTLPITVAHTLAAGSLPPHHTDPFDRMLIAQARAESLSLISVGSRFPRYDVELLPHPPARFVRFRIWPDGGVSRLRLFGVVSRSGREAFGLTRLGLLMNEELERELLACCGSILALHAAPYFWSMSCATGTLEKSESPINSARSKNARRKASTVK